MIGYLYVQHILHLYTISAYSDVLFQLCFRDLVCSVEWTSYHIGTVFTDGTIRNVELDARSQYLVTLVVRASHVLIHDSRHVWTFRRNLQKYLTFVLTLHDTCLGNFKKYMYHALIISKITQQTFVVVSRHEI